MRGSNARTDAPATAAQQAAGPVPPATQVHQAAGLAPAATAVHQATRPASAATAVHQAAGLAAAEPPRFVCAEVWGGNRPIDVPLRLPGIQGRVYSRPCAGGRGGDIHYVSICSSGLLSRLCIADVAGHGEAVARVSDEIHALLRRYMNNHDERRVLADLNRRLAEGALAADEAEAVCGLAGMTTAAALSYLPMTRRLTISYAGHPPGWFFEGRVGQWVRVPAGEVARREARASRKVAQAQRKEEANRVRRPQADPPDHGPARAGAPPMLMDLPLAVDSTTEFSRRSLRARPGDRLLLVTDGVLEAPNAAGELYGDARLERVLGALGGAEADAIVNAVLRDLAVFTGRAELVHDDVTIMAVAFVPGPRTGIWQVLKNQVLRRITG